MRKGKDKQKTLAFRQMPSEIQDYYLIRFLFCFTGLILITVFGIFTSLYRSMLVLFALFTFYIVTIMKSYWDTIHFKLCYYEGIVEKVDEEKNNISMPLLRSGISVRKNRKMVVKIDNGIKVVVPVKGTYIVSEGDNVRIYNNNTDVYPVNDNTILVNSPMKIITAKL